MSQWKKIWEDASNQKENQIRLLLDNSSFIMFFKYKGEVFGADEGGRVAFSNMMEPEEEDDTPEWREEANFTAFSLVSCLQGKQTPTMFRMEDLPHIKVITKEDTFNILMQK
jgi:hypothetical protein